MEQRKVELRELKKIYKRAKRKAVGGRNAFAVLFLVLAVLSAAVLFFPLIPVMILVFVLPEAAITFLAGNIWILYAIFGGSTALFLLFVCASGAQKRKLKKTEAYLNYRTLKLTIQAESEERK